MLQLIVDQIIRLVGTVLNECDAVHVRFDGTLHDVAVLGDKLVASYHDNSWVVPMVWRDRLPIGDDFTDARLLDLRSPWLRD
ncbi:hypothetical protein D3C85_1529110 [compost metagenome]